MINAGVWVGVFGFGFARLRQSHYVTLASLELTKMHLPLPLSAGINDLSQSCFLLFEKSHSETVTILLLLLHRFSEFCQSSDSSQNQTHLEIPRRGL